MARSVNLARRPFVNDRPLRRVTALLWIVGGGLLAADAFLFWGYVRGRSDQRGELGRLDEAIAGERRQLADLDRRLAAVDLEAQNLRAAFVNRQIAERSFAWSVLFDRLADLLPIDVRLVSLVPHHVGDKERARARPGAERPERVELAIEGVARRDEALLELLDALFADPAFTDPNLAREARDNAELRFALSVVYLPAVAEAAVPADGAGPPADEAAPAAAEPAIAGGET
jgi:Tfp pilus assembly protein PilN